MAKIIHFGNQPDHSSSSNPTSFKFWIVWLSLLLAVFSNRTGLNTNVMSRVALMLALTEKYSFEISPWQELTLDWSRTPEGSYYSNKAPAPSLLAAPLFAALYKPLNFFVKSRFTKGKDFNVAWNNMLAFIMWVISIVFQILPLAWVMSQWVKWLTQNNIPHSAILFFILATLFGNTGDFYMNSFHGHGYAMVLALMTLLFVFKKHWIWAGLALGLGTLGDYSSGLFIPLIGFYVFLHSKNRWGSICLKLGIGLFFPLIIFAFYHWKCFGGVLTLPQKFQNPLFVDSSAQFENFGVISWLPNFNILLKLLFGTTRGILFTQPYILFLVGFILASVIRSRRSKEPLEKKLLTGIVGIAFLLALLWMNAGFNGWHGGSAPGPRYLTAAFPCLSLAGALYWDRFNRTERSLLWLTLIYSVVFFSIVLAVGQTPPPEITLISYYTKVFTFQSDALKFGIRWIGLLLALGYGIRMERKSGNFKI